MLVSGDSVIDYEIHERLRNVCERCEIAITGVPAMSIAPILRVGREKRLLELILATFGNIVAGHTGQSSVRQAKLGVSDWVQVPIE